MKDKIHKAIDLKSLTKFEKTIYTKKISVYFLDYKIISATQYQFQDAIN